MSASNLLLGLFSLFVSSVSAEGQEPPADYPYKKPPAVEGGVQIGEQAGLALPPVLLYLIFGAVFVVFVLGVQRVLSIQRAAESKSQALSGRALKAAKRSGKNRKVD